MITMRHLKFLSIFILFLLCNLNIYSASIEGIVTDSATGKPLIGVNVFIVGTKLGAATNNKGYFIIQDLTPGHYTIRTSYIGYNTRNDRVIIKSSDELVKLNIILKVPFIDLDIMSTPKIEAYHKILQRLNKINPVMLIHIDSLTSANNILTAFLSIKNNAVDSFYVFKNYPCFQVIKPIVKDSTGKLIKPNMFMPDCLGEKTCPDLNDLLLIKPGKKIQYIAKMIFYNFSRLAKGKYSIAIKYEFKNLKKFNTYWCWGNKSAIQALVTGLRGSYVSSNSLEFINQ